MLLEEIYMMRKQVDVYIEKCRTQAVLPTYARQGDAGMDIYAAKEAILQPGETSIVSTGLKVAIPEGYEIQIRPRSGMSLKTPLRIANAPGTIDAGFRDEIGIIVHNTSQYETYTINSGDRIAQMVLQEVPQIKWSPVASVDFIGQNRGGGFGSSGK